MVAVADGVPSSGGTDSDRPRVLAVILVDRPIWRARDRRFAHLVSDESFEELHGFASQLGLPGRAFHRDHYDLPDAWWDRAVAAGAKPVDPRVLVRRLREAGLRRRSG